MVFVSAPKKRKGEDDYYKVVIISDPHAQFLDQKAFNLFLQIYTENKFDLLVCNGDFMDFPTLSSFAKRIETFNPYIIKEYSLGEEIDFVEKNILDPLHNAQKNTPKLFRIGNHEKRFLRPVRDNATALSEILEECRKRGSTKLEELLHFDKYNTKISYRHTDILRGKFALIHGTHLGQNRCEKYLREFMMSGTSGHSHQGLRGEKTIYGKQGIEWVESFCLRTIKNIEYMEEGMIPNWSHGFVTVWFKKGSDRMHIKQHKFNGYECEFHGKVYRS